MREPIKFALLNIQGLATKSNNKLESPEIKSLFAENDILMFTESWGTVYTNFNVSGFRYFNLNRYEYKPNSKRASGGIIIYVSERILKPDAKPLLLNDNDDIIWLKFDETNSIFSDCIYVCLCYNVPQGTSRQGLIDVDIFDRLLLHIGQIKSDATDADYKFLVCGDFNARVGDMNDFVLADESRYIDALPDDYTSDTEFQRVSEDETVNENGHSLIDFCKHTGLRIANGRIGDDADTGKCTYVGSAGSSLIDYVLVSENLFNCFSSFMVMDPNILSDHCTINFELNICSMGDEMLENRKGDSIRVKSKYVWEKSKSNQYKQALSSENTTESLQAIFSNIDNNCTDEQVEESIQSFVEVLDSVCKPLFEKYIPEVSQSQPKNTFLYNENCENKKLLFLNRLNVYRNNPNDENRQEMVNSRSSFKKSVREFRLDCRKRKTQYLLDNKYKNAKEYWKLLKNAQKHPESRSLSAQKFGDYFKAINDPNTAFYQADEDVIFFNERYFQSEVQIMFSELDEEISIEEIKTAIKQLKNNKSGGPDRLLNEFFSCGIDVLPEYLHKLFNVLFDKGYFPSSWAEGHIIPIHKKGSVDSPENYRGVTLLSTLGKLFTKILNSRLTEWAESYGVYIEAQAGFRSKMGTTDNIFVLHGLITHLINEGKKLYCAFVDFRKAFDFVNRDILWYKLIKIGVRGKILNVMRGMYSSVKSRVKYQNELSSEFECYLGVRQGECLSPFLFSMYINDIEDEFYLHGINGIEIDTIKVFLLLYADDITIFAETAEGLQEGLNLLSNYCTRWKLILNTDKTKVMVFRKGGILPRNLKFYYDETELEIVSSFSYLGIIFSTGGSFSNAQKTLAGQAQKAVFKLNSYLYNFDTLTTRHILELFDKLVSPILNYGAEVWGFFKANQIERAHLQFCKRLLGVKKCTQNNFIYGELGRLSYQKQRYFIIIKYWLKIVNSEENKMIKHVYNQMLLDLELDNRRVNWASLVKKYYQS